MQRVASSAGLLGELRSAIAQLGSDEGRARHWAMLRRALLAAGVADAEVGSLGSAGCSLGEIWDARLEAHEGAVREVIGAAQGEVSVAAFFRSLDDHYDAHRLTLVGYRGGAVQL